MSSLPGEGRLMSAPSWVSGASNCSNLAAFLKGDSQIEQNVTPNPPSHATTFEEPEHAPCLNSGYQATSSSIKDGNANNYGPQYAIDGFMVFTDHFAQFWSLDFFQSALDDPFPWLQIDYGCIKTVNLVMIMSFYESMRISKDGNATLKVHVGTIPAKSGELSQNEVCGTPFNGEIEPKTFEIFDCYPKTLSGRYVLIQLQTRGALEGLAINEVVVFTALSLHHGLLSFDIDIFLCWYQ